MLLIHTHSMARLCQNWRGSSETMTELPVICIPETSWRFGLKLELSFLLLVDIETCGKRLLVLFKKRTDVQWLPRSLPVVWGCRLVATRWFGVGRFFHRGLQNWPGSRDSVTIHHLEKKLLHVRTFSACTGTHLRMHMPDVSYKIWI